MKNCLTFLFYFFSIVYLHCQVKVIDMEDPGSLSKLLGSEINSVTELKINGKINSVDFTTLKGMKKLSVLDLSNSGANDGILPANIFEYNTILKNIILPSSLTTISNYAFRNAYNVSVDASKCSLLKNIGKSAFNGVKGKIILPDQLENLPELSFSSFNGTVVLPKNLKTIRKKAFYYSQINTLDLIQCSQLETIEDYAFQDASNLNLDLSKSTKLKNIGEYAFLRVKGKIILPDQLETLPYKSIAGFNGTVVLPKNLKTIEKQAFYDSQINMLDFSKCILLENIGQSAFCHVPGKVILPNQLETLPYKSFEGFYGTIVLPKNLKTIEKEAFYFSQINTLDLTQCPQLETIADYAFEFASNLNLDLSKSYKLKNIGGYAFVGVEGKIILPNHLETLPYKSFAAFKGTVVLPKNLKTIEKEAFYLSEIKEIILPESVNFVGEGAFSDASELTNFISKSLTPPELGKNVFNGINKTKCLLKVPNAALKLYANADQWKDFIFNNPIQITFNLPKDAIIVNNSLQVTTIVENTSSSNSAKNISVGYYLSDDNIWSNNDRLLTTYSIPEFIPAKGTGKFKTTLNFPYKAGKYYLIAVIDPKGIDKDQYKDSNIFSTRIQLVDEIKIVKITGLENKGKTIDKIEFEFNQPVNFSKESITILEEGFGKVNLDKATLTKNYNKQRFTLEGLAQYNNINGTYTLQIDRSKISDAYGNYGTGIYSEKWTVDPRAAEVKLYPNPVSSNFTIESNIPIKRYHINSIYGGNYIDNRTLPNKTNKLNISANNSWQKGIYLIYIYDENNQVIAAKRFSKI